MTFLSGRQIVLGRNWSGAWRGVSPTAVPLSAAEVSRSRGTGFARPRVDATPWREGHWGSGQCAGSAGRSSGTPESFTFGRDAQNFTTGASRWPASCLGWIGDPAPRFSVNPAAAGPIVPASESARVDRARQSSFARSRSRIITSLHISVLLRALAPKRPFRSKPAPGRPHGRLGRPRPNRDEIFMKIFWGFIRNAARARARRFVNLAFRSAEPLVAAPRHGGTS